MKKKLGLLAVVILLTVLAAGLWTAMRPKKVLVIKGNLTAREVAEVESAVKKEMRRRVFPSFSWASVKALPTSGKWYFKHDLQSIDASRAGHVYVTISGPEDPDITIRDRYDVVKGINGWRAYYRPDIYDIY